MNPCIKALGVVEQVGSKSNLKPGQAVALFTTRGYSEYIVSKITFKFQPKISVHYYNYNYYY